MMTLGRFFKRGMSCSEALEVLQSYLDGETDADVARQVASHLEACEKCDRESDVYRRIKTSLGRRQTAVDPEVMDALSRFGERVVRGDAQ